MNDHSKKRIRQLSVEAEQILLNRCASPFMKRMQSSFINSDDVRKPMGEVKEFREDAPREKRGLIHILQQFFSL